MTVARGGGNSMQMQRKPDQLGIRDRRWFLQGAGTAAGAVLAGCATGAKAKPGSGGHEHEVQISPGEDLMQEHGVVMRVLVVYDEAARRLEIDRSFDPATLAAAAGLIRHFVEDYHEKNEEQLVFPRLQAAGRHAELIATLLDQHQRGRAITNTILQRTKAGSTGDRVKYLRGFARMYRPHMGYEDTVVFPAFRELVGNGGYRELGERFETREHERVGEHGFEDAVAQVGKLEQAMGIGELARFTMP